MLAIGRQMEIRNCKIKWLELDIMTSPLLGSELWIMLTMNWTFVFGGIVQEPSLASAGIYSDPSFTDCPTLPALWVE